MLRAQLRLEQLHAAPDRGVDPGSEQPLGPRRSELRRRAADVVSGDRLLVEGFRLHQRKLAVQRQRPLPGSLRTSTSASTSSAGRATPTPTTSGRGRGTPRASATRYSILIDQVDTYRYDNVYELDLRLAKTFQIGGVTVIPAAELFNVANSGHRAAALSANRDVPDRRRVHPEPVLQPDPRGAEPAHRAAGPPGELLSPLLRVFSGPVREFRAGPFVCRAGMTRIPRKALGVAPAGARPRRSCRKEAAAGTASAGDAPRVARDVVLITIDTLRYDAVGFDGNTAGHDAQPRPVRRRGARLLAGALAQRHHAAVPHEHPDGHAAVPARRARERRASACRRRSRRSATRLKAKGYATGAFVGAYVLDSRYGLGARLRRLRRALPAPGRAARVQDPAGPRRGRRPGRARVVPRRRRASPGSCGSTSTIRTRRTSRRRPTRIGIPDDSYLGEVAYTDASLAPLLEAVRSVQPAPLLVVTGDHGEALRRPRRADARPLLLRGDAARSAVRLVPRISSRPGRNAVLGPAHRHPADDARRARRRRRRRSCPGQSLLPAGRVEAPRAATSRRSRPPSIAAGRRCAASRRGGNKYIDLPIQELYDLPTDPAEEKNLAPADARRAAAPAQAPARAAGGAARARHDRVRGGGQAAQPRLPHRLGGAEDDLRPGRRPEDAHRRRSDDPHLHRSLMQEEKFDEAVAVARRVVAENPHMKIGYHEPRHALCVAKEDVAGAIRVMRAGDGQRRGRRERWTGGAACCSRRSGRPAEAVEGPRAVRGERGPRDAERARHRPHRRGAARRRAADLRARARARRRRTPTATRTRASRS